MPPTDPPAVANWTLEMPDNDNERATIKAIHCLIKTHRKHAHYQNHSVQTLWDGMTPKDRVRGQSRKRWRRILYTHTALSLHAFFFARRTDLISVNDTERYSKYCMTFGVAKNLDGNAAYSITPAEAGQIVAALNDACWSMVNNGYAGSEGVELLSTDMVMVGGHECPSGDTDMQAVWNNAYNVVPVVNNQHLIEFDALIWDPDNPPSDPNFYLDPRYTSDQKIYRWYLHPRSHL